MLLTKISFSERSLFGLFLCCTVLVEYATLDAEVLWIKRGQCRFPLHLFTTLEGPYKNPAVQSLPHLPRTIASTETTNLPRRSANTCHCSSQAESSGICNCISSFPLTSPLTNPWGVCPIKYKCSFSQM